MNAAYLVLFSGLVGVGVTVVAGFVGAWLQNRRDHARWLLERRFEAYIAFDRLVGETLLFRSEREEFGASSARDLLAKVTGENQNAAKLRHIVDRAESLQKASIDAFAPISILGPQSVKDACAAVLEALKKDDDAGIRDASRRMVAAMATVLRSAR